MQVLMFCEKCGRPKKLTDYVLRHYVVLSRQIYCSDCHHSNVITKELKYYALKLKKQ